MITPTAEDCYVRVGAINTRYRVYGVTGSPVLLVHGIGSSLENWESNFEPLAEQHRVYALDLVGYGRSDKPPAAPYTMDYFGDFVAGFLRTQGLERAHIVGSSMGGMIALNLAIRYPGCVDRLVLVDPAGMGKEVTLLFRLSSLPLLGEYFTKPSLKGSAQLLPTFYYDKSFATPDLIQFDYEMSSIPGNQAAMLATLRRNVNLFGVRPAVVKSIVEKLGAITAPTLVIWGRQDATIPVAQAEVARKGIPNVTVHIFDHCAHVAMHEKADQFNKLVLDFLA